MTTWLITAVCLTGTLLNVKKNVLCFYLWAVGNIAWLVYDLLTGLYSRAMLDLIQLGFALWGIWEWSRNRA